MKTTLSLFLLLAFAHCFINFNLDHNGLGININIPNPLPDNFPPKVSIPQFTVPLINLNVPSIPIIPDLHHHQNPQPEQPPAVIPQPLIQNPQPQIKTQTPIISPIIQYPSQQPILNSQPTPIPQPIIQIEQTIQKQQPVNNGLGIIKMSKQIQPNLSNIPQVDQQSTNEQSTKKHLRLKQK